MLGEEEFQPVLTQLERLAALVLAVIAWLIRLLIGGSVVPEAAQDTSAPLADEAPSYLGPAP